MNDEAPRLLAEIHAARALMRETAAPARPSAGALWAHAVREPGRPVDIAVARAIRTDPNTARRYRALLAGQAVAHAPLAVAASDGSLSSRRIGPFTLEIVPAEADAPPLLVIRGEAERPPRAIEAMRGAEAVRLDLPPPIAGAVVLALDPRVAEASLLERLLGDPACAVFLL